MAKLKKSILFKMFIGFTSVIVIITLFSILFSLLSKSLCKEGMESLFKDKQLHYTGLGDNLLQKS